jgi:hypothetical protein
MKAATIALIVRKESDSPKLVETLSDDREITLLESALGGGSEDPLQTVYEARQKQIKEENEFGDYIEDLLSQPFVKPEIQEHAVQWFKSKIRIEQYQKTEVEAAAVIADYAYQIFKDDPTRTDFFLSGPTTMVRVRVFVLAKDRVNRDSSQAA